MNTMSYKGYTARVEYDERDDIFVGRILEPVELRLTHATEALRDAVQGASPKPYRDYGDGEQHGNAPEVPGPIDEVCSWRVAAQKCVCGVARLDHGPHYSSAQRALHPSLLGRQRMGDPKSDRLQSIRSIISFHGKTVNGLRAEFRKALDNYVAECSEEGVKPEKPVSGKLLLRVPPEVHGKALVAAKASGKSLNQWATEVLQRAVRSNG